MSIHGRLEQPLDAPIRTNVADDDMVDPTCAIAPDIDIVVGATSVTIPEAVAYHVRVPGGRTLYFTLARSQPHPGVGTELVPASGYMPGRTLAKETWRFIWLHR